MKSSPAVPPLLLAFSLLSPFHSALSQGCCGQSFSASGRTSAGRSSVITDFGPRDRAIVKFTSSAAGQITRGDNAWLVPGGPGGSSQTFYLPPPAPALTQGSSGETTTTTMTGATGATSTTTTDSNEETAEAKCPEPKQPSASASSVVHGRYEPANPPTAKGPNEKQDDNNQKRPGSTYTGNGGDQGTEQPPSFKDERGEGKSSISITGGGLYRDPVDGLIHSSPSQMNVENTLGHDLRGHGSAGTLDLIPNTAGTPDPTKVASYRHRGKSFTSLAPSDQSAETGISYNVPSSTEWTVNTPEGWVKQKEVAGKLETSSASGRLAVLEELATGNPNSAVYFTGHKLVQTCTGQPTKTTVVWRGWHQSGADTFCDGIVTTSWGGNDRLVEEFHSVYHTGNDYRTVQTKKSYEVGTTSPVITIMEERSDKVQFYSWGEQSVETTVKTGSGTDLVTQYVYWDPVDISEQPDTTSPNYGTLALQTNPDGSWTAHYRSGGIEYTFEPWGDTAAPSDIYDVFNLENVKMTQTNRGENTYGLFTNRITSVNGVTIERSETTLNAARTLRIEKRFFGTMGASFFATVTVLDSQRRPTEVIRLKQDQTDHTDVAKRISRTHYTYEQSPSGVGFPYYSPTAETITTLYPLDVTTVETEADADVHFKTVTVVERATQRTLVTARWIFAAEATEPADWHLVEHRKYLYDTRGRPTSTTYQGSASATSITEDSYTYTSDYVMTHTDAHGLLTTTTFDAFGRVISKIEDTSTDGAFWVPRRGMVFAYSARPTNPSLAVGGSNPAVLYGYRVTTKEEAYENSYPSVISSWFANSIGAVYPSGNWSRASITDVDGAGRTAYAKDPIGVETFTTYGASTPAAGTTTRTEAFTSGGSAARTTQTFRDGRAKSESGDTVIARTYDYPVPADPYKTTETSQIATGPLTTTVRDGLGRVTSVEAPTSASGTTSSYASVLKTSYSTYDANGQLQAIQRPGGSAGTYYQVSSRDLNVRISKSALSTDAVWNTGDANQQIQTITYAKHDELWWQQTKVGPSPATPTDFDSYTTLTEVALGPWVGDATTNPYLTGWTRVTSSSGAVTEQKSSVTRTSRKTETVTELNGAWQTKYRTLNGVPHQFQTPAGTVTYTISALRELLVEPSSQSLSWPRLSRSPTTGQILAQHLSTATMGSSSTIELYTYFAGSAGTKAGLLSTKVTNIATSPAVLTSSTTRYDYNDRAQLASQWGGGTYPVAYTYDSEGRMTTLSTYRSGSFTATTWASAVSGQTADVTTWVYVAGFAQPVEKQYAAGPALKYTYQDNGSLATRVWQRGVTTTYTYDAYARLQKVDYSDLTPDVTFTYLLTGQINTHADGTGTTTLTYTADGRTATETTTGGLHGTQSLTRTLDGSGRQQNLDAAWGSAALPQEVMVYDSSQRLSRVSAADRHAVLSNYNTNGFPGITAYKIGADPATASTYLTRTTGIDADGRIASISYGTTLQTFNYAYDRFHVKSTTRENGNQWVYAYDEKKQVQKAKKLPSDAGSYGIYATALKGQDTTYNYDQIGNRTSVVENTSPAKTTGYSPNSLNQYTTVTNTGGKFDVSGYRSSGSANILIYQNGGSGQTPDYQTAGSAYHFWKRLTHSGTPPWDGIEVKENGTALLDYGYMFVPPATNTPTYDDDGNLLTDARYTYTWDGENRLASVSWTAAQSPLNQSGVITYTYDGLSRRISRKSTYKVGGTGSDIILDYTGYLFDGWNHIMTVRFNADETVRGRVAAYVWGPDIGSRWTANANWQAAGGVGGLLLVLDGASTTAYGTSPPTDPTDDDYFPLMDRLGNVTAYKKASTGTPASQLDAVYEYDAFGQEIRSSGIAADKVPYHFSTKFTDEQTGLNYYGFRWYEPGSGRWLGRDPIEEWGGINLYTLLNNQGLSNFDFLGLKTSKTWRIDKKVSEKKFELWKLKLKFALEVRGSFTVNESGSNAALTLNGSAAVEWPAGGVPGFTLSVTGSLDLNGSLKLSYDSCTSANDADGSLGVSGRVGLKGGNDYAWISGDVGPSTSWDLSSDIRGQYGYGQQISVKAKGKNIDLSARVRYTVDLKTWWKDYKYSEDIFNISGVMGTAPDFEFVFGLSE